MAAGHQLREANLTVKDATAWCLNNRTCAGFTANTASASACSPGATNHGQADDSAQVLRVYFKSQAGSNSDASWSSWTKPGTHHCSRWCSAMLSIVVRAGSTVHTTAVVLRPHLCVFLGVGVGLLGVKFLEAHCLVCPTFMCGSFHRVACEHGAGGARTTRDLGRYGATGWDGAAPIRPHCCRILQDGRAWWLVCGCAHQRRSRAPLPSFC